MQSTFMQQLMVEKNIILFLEINGVTVYDPCVKQIMLQIIYKYLRHF